MRDAGLFRRGARWLARHPLARALLVAVLFSAPAFLLWHRLAPFYWRAVVKTSLAMHHDPLYRVFILAHAHEGDYAPLVGLLTMALVIPGLGFARRLGLSALCVGAVFGYDVLKALTYSPALLRPGRFLDLYQSFFRGPGRTVVAVGLGLLLIELSRAAESVAPPRRWFERPWLLALPAIPAALLVLFLAWRPSPAERSLNFAETARVARQNETALRYYEEAHQLDPSLVQAAVGAAGLLLAQHEAKSAARIAEATLPFARDNVELQLVLAEAHEHNAQGVHFGPGFDVAGARANYRQAIALRPDSAPLLYHLGIVSEYNDAGVRHGDGYPADEAMSHFRNAIALDPKDTGSRLLLSGIQAERGQWSAAVAEWRTIAALEPRSRRADTAQKWLAEVCKESAHPDACR